MCTPHTGNPSGDAGTLLATMESVTDGSSVVCLAPSWDLSTWPGITFDCLSLRNNARIRETKLGLGVETGIGPYTLRYFSSWHIPERPWVLPKCL
ncbi:unnamed protein product [Phytophthora fragariaefolia]|uniref:Unnamed protein product n=1 Tax=Phytophthora fragariaefolia TaxID=1490495 RepID=A0A9W6YBS0_9STRA|nr:unnamed protein product [Phytophthora fragariaefolia]